MQLITTSVTGDKTPIRVLIVEDHSLLIDGIKSLLLPFGCEIVAEIKNGLDVYAACQTHHPHLVLIDLGLPGMDGIDVIQQLNHRWPELVILVITATSEEHKAAYAFSAGAHGYVLKKSSQQTLLTAIKTVLAGHRFIDPNLDQVEISPSFKSNRGQESPLTTRERQVLKLIAEGHRNRDISEKLSISLKTVETHRLNLMRKLDSHNVAGLTNWARRLGLI